MNNSESIGSGPQPMSSPPRQGLLEQIDFQIKVHESKAKTLSILKMKLANDPELEHVIQETIHMISHY